MQAQERAAQREAELHAMQQLSVEEQWQTQLRNEMEEASRQNEQRARDHESETVATNDLEKWQRDLASQEASARVRNAMIRVTSLGLIAAPWVGLLVHLV